MVELPFGIENVKRVDGEPQQLDVGLQQRAAERGQRGAQLGGAQLALRLRALVGEEVAPPVDQHTVHIRNMNFTVFSFSIGFIQWGVSIR